MKEPHLMPYCRIPGEPTKRRFRSRILRKGVSIRPVLAASNWTDAAHRPRTISSNTFGLTLAASTRIAIGNLARLSTPCLDGMGRLLFAMSISQTFLQATALRKALQVQEKSVVLERVDLTGASRTRVLAIL